MKKKNYLDKILSRSSPPSHNLKTRFRRCQPKIKNVSQSCTSLHNHVTENNQMIKFFHKEKLMQNQILYNVRKMINSIQNSHQAGNMENEIILDPRS